MKLKFLGAAQTVTGSKYLLKTGDQTLLVDCGLFQGRKELRRKNWAPFPADISQIDAVILTHAHIDHSGYLPRLVQLGYRGPIWATNATRALCDILLLDSGRIQEEDARRANKYGYTKHHPALPLYTEEDAHETLRRFKVLDLGREYSFGEEVKLQLSNAGHILGSAMLTFRTDTTSLIFTGDLGRPYDPIMNPPAILQNTDVLVLESTYGNRLHPQEETFEKLGAIIRDTASRGGTVVIPSFAVARAQRILYLLQKLKANGSIPDLPIYLDSPMAQNVTDIMCRFHREHKLSPEQCSAVCSVAHYTRTTEASKRLNSLKYPAVIISASGMAEGGRVLFHLKRLAPDPANTIVFAGFQAPMTRGDRILRGDREVKIHGSMVPVRAQVEWLEGLSSHADYEEILAWLEQFRAPIRQVYLTHGEPTASENLKHLIEKKFGWNVHVPAMGEEVLI